MHTCQFASDKVQNILTKMLKKSEHISEIQNIKKKRKKCRILWGKNLILHNNLGNIYLYLISLNFNQFRCLCICSCYTEYRKRTIKDFFFQTNDGKSNKKIMT